MEPVVELPQPLPRDVRVDLRGRYVGVAEHRLERSQIGSALEEAGLIRRVYATPGAARYDANLARHHHFVCRRCGFMRDVYSDDLDAITPPAEARASGRIEDVEVQFRGVCDECGQKEEPHE